MLRQKQEIIVVRVLGSPCEGASPGRSARSRYAAENQYRVYDASMPRIPRHQAEQLIFNRFAAAFEAMFGSPVTNAIHRDRPDFEVIDPRTGDRLGVEITAAYQNPREARIQYWDLDYWGTFTGSVDELVESLNRVIADKVEKVEDYEFEDKVALAVFLGSLVFQDKTDVGFFRHMIVIPENSYSDIWLIVRNRTDQSDELYPLQ